MIESPFNPNELSEDAVVAIHSITKLAGADDFFYVAVRHEGDKVNVRTSSSVASEGLVEHLRMIGY